MFARIKQTIALLLSVTLIATSGDFARAAEPASKPPISVPPGLGQLVDSYHPESESADAPPQVILVEDLHARYGVQKNIAGILDSLSQRFNFALAVEGASGPIDSSVMALFPDQKIKQAAADYLMKEGELTGAEYYAVMRGEPNRLTGVEDPRYYNLHRDLFRQTLAQRQHLVELLRWLRSDLLELRPSVYSKALKQMQTKIDAFEAGKMDLAEYSDYLAAESQAKGMEIQRPDLSSPAAVRQAWQQTDALAFMVKLQKAGTKREKELVQVEHDLDFLISVAGLQATEAEVRGFGPRMNSFVALCRSLLESNGNKSFDEAAVRELISSSIDYYAFALARNMPIVENTLNLLATSCTVHGAPCTAVLVAGGFHTAPITGMLRQRKVSYAVITPNLDSAADVEQDLYVKRLSGQLLTPEEILQSIHAEQSSKFANAVARDRCTLAVGVAAALLGGHFLYAGLAQDAAQHHQSLIQALPHYIGVLNQAPYVGPALTTVHSWISSIPAFLANFKSVAPAVGAAGLFPWFRVPFFKRREPTRRWDAGQTPMNDMIEDGHGATPQDPDQKGTGWKRRESASMSSNASAAARWSAGLGWEPVIIGVGMVGGVVLGVLLGKSILTSAVFVLTAYLVAMGTLLMIRHLIVMSWSFQRERDSEAGPSRHYWGAGLVHMIDRLYGDVIILPSDDTNTNPFEKRRESSSASSNASAAARWSAGLIQTIREIVSGHGASQAHTDHIGTGWDNIDNQMNHDIESGHGATISEMIESGHGAEQAHGDKIGTGWNNIIRPDPDPREVSRSWENEVGSEALAMAKRLQQLYDSKPGHTRKISKNDLEIMAEHLDYMFDLTTAVDQIASIPRVDATKLLLAGRISLIHHYETSGLSALLAFLSRPQKAYEMDAIVNSLMNDGDQPPRKVVQDFLADALSQRLKLMIMVGNRMTSNIVEPVEGMNELIEQGHGASVGVPDTMVRDWKNNSSDNISWQEIHAELNRLRDEGKKDKEIMSHFLLIGFADLPVNSPEELAVLVNSALRNPDSPEHYDDYKLERLADGSIQIRRPFISNMVSDFPIDKGERRFPEEGLFRRVQQEYTEMPGLKLTVEQAARLFNVDQSSIRPVLEELVAAKFLNKTRNDVYVRADDAKTPGKRGGQNGFSVTELLTMIGGVSGAGVAGALLIKGSLTLAATVGLGTVVLVGLVIAAVPVVSALRERSRRQKADLTRREGTLDAAAQAEHSVSAAAKPEVHDSVLDKLLARLPKFGSSDRANFRARRDELLATSA
jgi:hypothetical protein